MAKYQKLTTKQLQERLTQGENFQVVDVREKKEVRSGTIPEAKHIPLGELPVRLGELNPDVKTVFVCASGNRSKTACQYVVDHGLSKVWNLDGGMKKWKGPMA